MNKKITSIVSGTTTNAHGLSLFLELKSYYEKGEKLVVSLENCPVLSSSFLNSSIGSFIDEYGMDELKKTISFVNYTSSQIEYIKTYVSQYLELTMS